LSFIEKRSFRIRLFVTERASSQSNQQHIAGTGRCALLLTAVLGFLPAGSGREAREHRGHPDRRRTAVSSRWRDSYEMGTSAIRFVPPPGRLALVPRLDSPVTGYPMLGLAAGPGGCQPPIEEES